MLLVILWALIAKCTSQTTNRAPYFVSTGDMARFAIAEDTAPESAVYQLHATDPEGLKVFYSISGEYFRVDKDTGIVYLSRALDREKLDIITVVISVTDEGLSGTEPNTVSLLREIPVLDVNDNAPEFLERPYTVKVLETAAPGTKIYANVTVQDKDGGINGEVLLSCIPENSLTCKTFDIATEKVGEGLYRGIISLHRELDYEKSNGHSLTIKAVDRAKDPGKRLSATANVAIEVLDIQDQLPIFLQTPYSATVPENTEEGVSVLKVGAQDGDLGDPRIVKLSLVNENLGCFTLVPSNKDAHTVGKVPVSWYHLVTTDTPLDREDPSILEAGGIYTFQIRATELINGELPAETVETTVTVVVTDVDDQLPGFNQREYHVNVSEIAALDSPLPGLNMVVTDRDVGENARFYLSLRDVYNLKNTFAVSPKAGQSHTAVTIRVNDTTYLDYDVDNEDAKFIVFDVLAGVRNDYGVVREVTSSRVFVHVQNANDNIPTFDNESIYISVPEDASPGSLITPIQAEDKDKDNFGKIRYSLAGFSSNRFRTDEQNGGIFVGSMPLDYELQRSYTFTLLATDGGNLSSSLIVYVDVIDINDNKPKFEVLEYSRTIRENAASFEPEFFITATDIDGPTQGGGQIRYEVISRNFVGNIISVNESTGEVFLNGTASSADTPKGQYELSVRAWDFGRPPLSADVRVNVRVGIIGNQRPYFRGNAKHNHSGIPYYKVSIREDISPKTDILRLDAIDPDGSTTELRFSITSNGRDNFIVDEREGVLKTADQVDLDLDRNPKNYSLWVVVNDAGYPIAESSSVEVIVTVTDVNNKPPAFQQNTYTFYLKDSADINESIGAVKATDTDTTAQLVYKILPPVNFYDKAGLLVKGMMSLKDVFEVTSRGDILLRKPLAVDVSSAVIKVECEDKNSENGLQIDTAEVLVFVQSLQTMNPVFLAPDWSLRNPKVSVEIDEEQPVGTVVYEIRTKAPGRVAIKTIQNDQPDIFNIREDGEIVVLRRLDYEILGSKVYNLSVRAVLIEEIHFDVKQTQSGDSVLDLRHLPQLHYADALIQIRLKNVNDFAPVFERKVYTKRVSENVKPTEVIATVRAVDFDNDTITYGISGENANLFTINATGSVFVRPNNSLDRERKENYKLNLTVSDGLHRDSATLLLEVLDVNDSPPIFEKDAYTAVVLENAAIGTFVTDVIAKDADLGLSSEITYKIAGDSEITSLFLINPNTGAITTNRVLTGRGREEPYKIIVQAADKGDLVLDAEGKKTSPQLTSETQLNIFIGDVVRNDGVPQFVRPVSNQKAVISEDAPVNSAVFQVIATDPDDPKTPEGQIRYTFLASEGLETAMPFRINQETGLITTSALLDRETKSKYQLIVMAEDRGDIPQQATRLLEIEIQDVDDHLPYFKREREESPMIFQIKEEIPSNTEVGLLQCYDEDVGENALIDYIITDGNDDKLWRVESTDENIGMLKVNGRIDREQKSLHVLTVKCFKKRNDGVKLNYARPYNAADLSEIQVQIIINDIDDNKPQFAQSWVTLGVRPTVPADTSLTTLQAFDADFDNAPIEYKIKKVVFHFFGKTASNTTEGNNNLFILDSQAGTLKTVTPLQKYSDGIFSISVTANNTNDYFANATVQIFVLRDRKLSKIIFNKPPSEMKKLLPEIQRNISSLLPKSEALTIFDTQYVIKEDGSLDLSSTSSCFQVITKNRTKSFKDVQRLLNDTKIREILNEYNAELFEQCAEPHYSFEKRTWIQIAVLVIALLIGLLALAAAFSLCCFYSRLQNQIKSKRKKVIPPASTADYMSIRSRPMSHIGANKLAPPSQIGSLIGSQLILPPKSEISMPRSGPTLVSQSAAQLGSQLVILSPSTLGRNSSFNSRKQNLDSQQVTYEIVREGNDNPAYED